MLDKLLNFDPFKSVVKARHIRRAFIVFVQIYYIRMRHSIQSKQISLKNLFCKL